MSRPNAYITLTLALDSRELDDEFAIRVLGVSAFGWGFTEACRFFEGGAQEFAERIDQGGARVPGELSRLPTSRLASSPLVSNFWSWRWRSSRSTRRDIIAAMESGEANRERIRECAGLLGITGRVSAAALKAAYRRAMMKWHPDLHQGKSTMMLAEWNAKRINEARAFLAGLPVDTPVPGSATVRVRRERSARAVFEDPAAIIHRLRSEVFSAVGYNESSQTLYLRFCSGATYKYLGVPKGLVGKFLRSRAKPLFARNRIFSCFTYFRC